MEDENTLITLIDENPRQDGIIVPGAGVIDRLTVGAGQDEHGFLRAVVNIGTGVPVSRFAAVSALVAERIILLKIPRGPQMLSPISALVIRNLGISEITSSTLVDLLRALGAADDSRSRIECGIQLGDRATHMAAGFAGSRHFTDENGERTEYARRLARTGYGAALDAAERSGASSVSRTVEQIIPDLMGRLSDVIHIVASFKDDEFKKMIDEFDDEAGGNRAVVAPRVLQ